MKATQEQKNSKTVTKSQPETIWHVGETPRRSGISACPVSPEDLSSQHFLIVKWDKERQTQFDQRVPVNYQTAKNKKNGSI